MQTELAIEMRQIVKQFGTVMACDQVDLKVFKGEIHALLGENGAGKSSLMCMLSGVYRPTAGDIHIRGNEVRIHSPKEAAHLGIGMVFQNFRLVQSLTATENIVLGERSSFWRGSKWLKSKQQEIAEISQQYGLTFPVDVPIYQLSLGEQQRVEIVKTLYRGADIIILDEPTSVLTPGEAERLFETLKFMKTQGKTVMITTHKMKEILAVSDRISVMRKGRMTAERLVSETNERELAQLMVGQSIVLERKYREPMMGARQLSIEQLVVFAEKGRKVLDNLSMEVNEGEIVGIAGVAGNGQKELAEAITGLRPWGSGSIRFYDEPLKNGSALSAIKAGISHVPENRMKTGMAGSLGASDNLLLKSYRSKERSVYGVIRQKTNKAWSEGLVKQFEVVTPSTETPVRQLSGGNQQKLLFAREVSNNPRMMIASHPSQGLDIGATEAVHKMILDLRASGSGIILISEDLDELLQLSDRILVMYGGRIVGEMHHDDADREHIGLLMAGTEIKAGKDALV